MGVLADRQAGGFLAIAALVGVAVGVGASALILLVDRLALLTDGLSIHDGSWWVFLTVPLGLLLAWLVARWLAPEVAGDGVPEAAAALAVHGGRMRFRAAPLKVLATALTVGGGGSAGREGPIVQIGATLGSAISRRFNLGEDQVRSLVAAGAGAGIGASFNAPIAGMLFALEVILASFAVRHMSAIVMASVTAAVTSRLIVGEELAIRVGTSYVLGDFRELFVYAGLAIVLVFVGLFFLRFLNGLERWSARHERLSWLKPILFGLVVAALIYVEPRLFGTGQEVTNALLIGERGGGEFWWVLGLLALGKVVATSLTISSGASGGAFMPSLFMGAALGAGFAALVEPLWGFEPGLETGAFAVVGMAAMFAVVGRAPLTAILLVFEVTGAREYLLILPLLLTATLATFLAERFSPDSVYTAALRRRGITVRRSGDVDLLDTITVGRVMTTNLVVASPVDSLAQAQAILDAHRSHGMPVVEDGVVQGILSVTDIVRAGGPSDEVRVSDAMTRRPVTVVPSTPVSSALERMAALGVGRLPVVDENDPEKLVGVFRREDAVRAYHEALSASTDHHLHRERLAQRTHPGAGYYDFRIPPGSMADGRAVSEVAWPEGSTLVSVRRGREVLVPTGTTTIRHGDVVTAFGTETSKERMIERLNAGADEPTAEIELDLDLVEPDDGGDNGP